MARPGQNTKAHTETVKFLIDLRDDNRIYFFNSKKWFSHHGFVRRFIDNHVDCNRFVTAEYMRQDRRFILGSLMRYLDGDFWTIELSPSDTLGTEQIAWMFARIAERVTIAPDLRFRPKSPEQIARVEVLADRLPLLSIDAINASIKYQPVVTGIAYGYIRLLRGTIKTAEIGPYDIVVIDQVPIAISPVAALVTGELQAPLAHVAVLCRNRNTPDMAVRHAVDLDLFQRFQGELVKLTVSGQDYSVEPADITEAEVAWQAARPLTPFLPERELQQTGLVDLHSLPTGAISYVGAKAAQLGELGAIGGIGTPGGFALPLSAYVAHLEAAGLTGEIDAMLADPDFRSSASARAKRLTHLRAAIVAHPVEPGLLTAIAAKLRGISTSSPFIFRSSTNAEDLPGFNGAGLYESIHVQPDPTTGQIADALRFVWSSVWLQRAFEEREWYRIDHRTVAMAILIQPLLEGAIATGVAITENPFKPDRRAVFINSQVKGASVTGASGNELPEQYLVVIEAEYRLELLGYSTLTDGALILHEVDIVDLTDQLLRIHEVMLPAHAESANAMDVEFALTAERRFVILQARPYTIVYDLDRIEPEPQNRDGLFERVVRRARILMRRFRTRRCP